MDWSCIQEDVFLRILRFLQNNGQFDLDGPSIRATNRYWRDCVNKSIIRISPKTKHRLLSADVSSLSRFNYLASLDIRSFTRCRKWSIRICQATRVLKSVSKAKPLSCIRLDASHITNTSVECIREMNSVKVLDICSGKMCSPKLARLSSLQVEELTIVQPIVCDSAFIAAISGVRKLDVSISQTKAEYIKALGGLNELTIHTDADDVEWLSQLDNLIALHCTSGALASVCVIALLSRLKSLTLTVSEEALLERNEWDCILRRLTSLNLRSKLFHVPLRSDFFKEATSLENLTLQSFSVKNATFERAGWRYLRSLTLDRYVLEEDFAFLRSLTQLKTLCSRRYMKWKYDPVPFMSSIRKLTQLKEFEFCCKGTSMLMDFKQLSAEKVFLGLQLLKINEGIEAMYQENWKICHLIHATELPRLATIILVGPATYRQLGSLFEGFSKESVAGAQLRTITAQVAMSYSDKQRATALFRQLNKNRRFPAMEIDDFRTKKQHHATY